MQALFAKFLPIEPLPAGFAIQLKERVLAEVAVMINADKTGMISSVEWLRILAQKSSFWFFTRLWLLTLIIGSMLWLVAAFVAKLFGLAPED